MNTRVQNGLNTKLTTHTKDARRVPADDSPEGHFFVEAFVFFAPFVLIV